GSHCPCNLEELRPVYLRDIYNPCEFEPAIEGCQFVFHVATPMVHDTHSSQDTIEAVVAGVRRIADSCIRSQTVKRLIYTASVMASSPLNQDGTGFESSLDESCWTLLDLSYNYGDEFTMGYTKSKTLAEKEILSYNDVENGKLEISGGSRQRSTCNNAKLMEEGFEYKYGMKMIIEDCVECARRLVVLSSCLSSP
ncbi:hypothetical protein RJ640_019029, partial [Escallonia rubra]